MTGALYFRNEVIITDRGETYRVFTMQTNPSNILAEQGFTLNNSDIYSFEPGEDGVKTLAITRSYSVVLRADGENVRVDALEGETVDDFLSRKGIVLAERDLVHPYTNMVLSEESGINFIQVTRAFEITVYIDGESATLPVTPDGMTTFSEVLSLEGIKTGANVITTQNLSALAYPGMSAEINLITYVNRTVTGTKPFETIYEYTNLRAIGDDEIITAGVPGSERLVIIDTLVDGVVVDSEIISVEILSEPVTEVISAGAALAAPYSMRDFPEIELVNGRPVNYEYKISGPSTAYTAGPTGGTASGRTLEVGTVAIDPRIIPYGSLVYIVTQCGTIVYGAAVAADTGGFIHNTNIVVDVFKGLTSTNFGDAVNWGVKNVDVYVINTGVY
jgi:3D (Asp-Asp-Asp) domain-containing protein/uncharacterized protein YabE (DUF348 family)